MPSAEAEVVAEDAAKTCSGTDPNRGEKLAPYLTLDVLLEVITDLLPHDVLCFKLLGFLRGRAGVAGSKLGVDACDIHEAFAAFESAERDDSDCAGVRKIQHYSLSFARLCQASTPPTTDAPAAEPSCQPQQQQQQQQQQPQHGDRQPQHRIHWQPCCVEETVAVSEKKSAASSSLCLSIVVPGEAGGDQSVGAAVAESVRGSVPWLPPASHGNLRHRCFALFEEPQSSLCGKVLSVLLVVTIAISTVAFVVESMPEFRHRPPECASRRAAGLPPTAEACEPQPDEAFYAIEACCIAIFLVDYAARMLTVHAAPDLMGRSGLYRTLRYACQPLNIIDALAIFPFFVNLALGDEGKVNYLRALRLARILRPFKLARHHKGMMLFSEVMLMSGEPLLILLFFNAIIAVIFGSLIYYAEGQQYSVAPEFTAPTLDLVTGASTAASFPTGVYVRLDSAMEKDIVTPFSSIPRAIWWVLVTMTTVGYGDYAPTTRLGKVIGVACFYIGIIFLALPISVLGNNFEIVYERTVAQMVVSSPSLMTMKAKRSATSLHEQTSFFPRNGGFRLRLFIVLEDPLACRLSKWISMFVMTAIVFSTFSFVLESMPAFNHTPDACTIDRLTVEDCRPVPWSYFYMIEIVCVVIFTLDYFCRVGTVHAASPAACGLSESREYTPVTLTLMYCLQWLNIIDFLAIVPFYVEACGGGGGSAAVLRVLRLVRAFRMLKMPKLRACAEMLTSVVTDALPALMMLIFMSALTCVFSASCIVFAESSDYSVEHFQEDYPDGVYIRPTVDGYGIEVSPFRSIPYAFWWFFATATTVGYGDDVPTTSAGRTVGILTFYAGLLLLALPVTIVGGSFNKHYPDFVKEFGMMSGEADSDVPSDTPWDEGKHGTREQSGTPSGRRAAWD